MRQYRLVVRPYRFLWCVLLTAGAWGMYGWTVGVLVFLACCDVEGP